MTWPIKRQRQWLTKRQWQRQHQRQRQRQGLKQGHSGKIWTIKDDDKDIMFVTRVYKYVAKIHALMK